MFIGGINGPNGIEGLPHIFEAFKGSDVQFIEACFGQTLLCFDNLHNSKGIIKAIIDCEKRHPEFAKVCMCPPLLGPFKTKKKTNTLI